MKYPILLTAIIVIVIWGCGSEKKSGTDLAEHSYFDV